jgi:large conductance mechanosensitive channel
MSVIKEFREFALRGNVVDLAVGVIIGGAFGGIVDSLVADILMPVLGVFIGGLDFSVRVFEIGGVKIAYGKFFQAIITFAITAFALFLLIKGMNSLRKNKMTEAAPAPEEPNNAEKLLTEIRDLLKQR